MTNIDPPHQDQPISDDQELASVLAGMQQKNEELVQPVVEPSMQMPAAPAADMQYEEIATPAPSPVEPTIAPVTPITVSQIPSTGDSVLDEIKRQALDELRPLATKLDLPADEKFDALLLIIRSTDDKTLIGAAHDAAKNITDEEKRAQALFDIVKEIDYFSTAAK